MAKSIGQVRLRCWRIGLLVKFTFFCWGFRDDDDDDDDDDAAAGGGGGGVGGGGGGDDD